MTIPYVYVLETREPGETENTVFQKHTIAFNTAISVAKLQKMYRPGGKGNFWRSEDGKLTMTLHKVDVHHVIPKALRDSLAKK